jgi:hypothetical protein
MFRAYLSNGSKISIIPPMSYIHSYVIYHGYCAILQLTASLKKTSPSFYLQSITTLFLRGRSFLCLEDKRQSCHTGECCPAISYFETLALGSCTRYAARRWVWDCASHSCCVCLGLCKSQLLCLSERLGLCKSQLLCLSERLGLFKSQLLCLSERLGLCKSHLLFVWTSGTVQVTVAVFVWTRWQCFVK